MSGVPPVSTTGQAPPLAAGTMSSPMDGVSMTDGRKGPRRELSQSKRAAQNRAAQRAFRQRKEGYIKQLEFQVSANADLEAKYKELHDQNFALREYIIHLQSKLLEGKIALPTPPPHLDLTLSSRPEPSVAAAAAAASALAHVATAANQAQVPESKTLNVLAGNESLDQVEKAVAVLNGHGNTNGTTESQYGVVSSKLDAPDVKVDEEMQTAEEIDRQLQ